MASRQLPCERQRRRLCSAAPQATAMTAPAITIFFMWGTLSFSLRQIDAIHRFSSCGTRPLLELNGSPSLGRGGPQLAYNADSSLIGQGGFLLAYLTWRQAYRLVERGGQPFLVRVDQRHQGGRGRAAQRLCHDPSRRALAYRHCCGRLIVLGSAATRSRPPGCFCICGANRCRVRCAASKYRDSPAR